MSLLIEPAALHDLLESGSVRVLDVRWSLGGPAGAPLHEAGHIPSAVYVDLETELAGHGRPDDGRHPLPPVQSLQAAARRWGIRSGDTVVVYDDLGNLSAARAWWLLRHAGLADVRLLDGGLRAWREAGLPLETGPVAPEAGDIELAYGSMPVLDLDGAGEQPERGVLLDARAPERFRGEKEPVDPRAGHIPGARNAPAAANLDDAGRFLPPETLRARFAELGVDSDTSVAVYCGSGVTAAADVAALELAGIRAALYPGSWSQWSNHAERPVETGAAR